MTRGPGNATKNLTVTVAAPRLAATAGSSFQYQWRLDG
jgi:hypothetical protein